MLSRASSPDGTRSANVAHELQLLNGWRPTLHEAEAVDVPFQRPPVLRQVVRLHRGEVIPNALARVVAVSKVLQLVPVPLEAVAAEDHAEVASVPVRHLPDLGF